jgi:hypothetical protein
LAASLRRLFAGLVVALMLMPLPASAIPLFAHQYGVSCEKCHTVIPHLNQFGADFLASGYRIPGVNPGPAFPFAAKANLVASSVQQGNGPNGAGLPKEIVDEIEAFAAGGIGSRASYLIEQYIVDGGEPGLLRDAWINDRMNPWQARIPVYAQAGSFTLPLPVDPETFRDTYQSYVLYTQTVGSNPFNFFDPKVGGRLGIGDPLRGASVQLFAGPGHDRQSGLATLGTDTMIVAQDAFGPYTATFYRYAGTRPIAGGPNDRFDRLGYALTYDQWGRFSSETVVQTGWDSNCGVISGGCASSGGFTQLRYAFNKRFFALGRYEGTYDPITGIERDGVVLLGYGPTENTRMTIEDVLTHTSQPYNTVNFQFSIAY